MNSPHTALIVGASGLVGSYTLQRLLTAEDKGKPLYERVIALVRKPLQVHDTTIVPPHAEHRLQQCVLGSFGDSSVLQEHLQQYAPLHHIYCTLGTTIRTAGSQEAFRAVDCSYPLAIAQAALSLGATRFGIVTALGADAHSTIFYNRVKGEVESALQELPYEALRILRPSLLLGKRQEFRLGERVAVVLSPLMNALLIGSLKRYRAIEASVVAWSLVAALQDHRSGVWILENDTIQHLYDTAVHSSQTHEY
jgi:uncharacterized protein YbjT (DUF2867 family)